MVRKNGSLIENGEGSKGSDYWYCPICGRVRYEFELDVSGEKQRCSVCGSSDLEMPKWIECPHRKTMVKCVTGGAGLSKSKTAYECSDRCRELGGESE